MQIDHVGKNVFICIAIFYINYSECATRNNKKINCKDSNCKDSGSILEMHP